MPPRKYYPRDADGVMVPFSAGTLSQTNIQTKAGTPTDADIPGGSSDGDVIIDTTASKIWVRIGGTWKATVALT